MPNARWLTDQEMDEHFPLYREAAEQIEAILEGARLKGMSPQEIASIMATLHAKAIADLDPPDEQIEFVVGIFREAIITLRASK
jgi:hypothetical protein